MRSPVIAKPGAPGFSLVELMVSVVLGMLALVFATRLVLSSEQNKDMSLGGSDSMQNGMQAMLTMKGDLEQSGFGLNDPILNGCNTIFADANGFQLAAATRGTTAITPLTAVVITVNSSGSDAISVYSGTAQGGTATLGITSTGAGGGKPTVDRVPFGFARNDVVVAAEQNADLDQQCVLSQITADTAIQPAAPASPFLTLDGAARFNSAAAAGASFNANTSRLFNLGPAADLSLHTWSVSNGYLMLRATNLDGASLRPVPVIDNIVAIKAQYGFDTRSPALFSPDSGVQQTGMQTNRWSATMIDADGDGVTGDHDDWARVGAVRLAVVARGRNVEKVTGSTTCNATPAALSVFASAEPQGVTAVPVELNLAVSGDTMDWKCYRYRVFETIVPLRNAGWRPTATRPTS